MTIKTKLKIIIPTLFFLSVISLLYISSTLKKQKQIKTTQSINEEGYKSLTPGESDLPEAQIVLGEPLKEETENSFKVLYYPSQSAAREDKLYFKEERLILIKEIVSAIENRKSNEIASKYGQAPYVLYGTDSTSGFYLYIFPDKGIAYLGNPYSQDMLEIWHFQKTTIENFSKDFAPEYEDTIPVRQ